jgi:hypothetical protein
MSFSVTKEKLCEGGSYMWEGKPQQQYCEKLMSTPQGIKQFYQHNCGRPWAGRPLRKFEFYTLSNGRWENNLKVSQLSLNGTMYE